MKSLTIIALLALSLWSCSEPAEKTETIATEVKEAGAEAPVAFAEASLVDVGKRGVAALSSGDIDSWMNDFADTSRYFWNNGDSLIGKAAIASYWKKRRTEAIDSISFTNQVWLPIIVNKPQATERAGTWLLGWYFVTAKYKSGKKMQQWIHTDMHFNSAGKVDQTIQYLDRVPINAAMAK